LSGAIALFARVCPATASWVNENDAPAGPEADLRDFGLPGPDGSPGLRVARAAARTTAGMAGQIGMPFTSWMK
jgi:hypothetical protein